MSQFMERHRTAWENFKKAYGWPKYLYVVTAFVVLNGWLVGWLSYNIFTGQF